MAKTSIVTISRLQERNRIDAEFFQTEYLLLDEYLKGAPTISRISNTVDLQSNGAFEQIFRILNDHNEKVVPYIRSGNVGDFFLNRDDLELISKEAHLRLPKTHTRPGDVLMARKGKIGGATLIFDDEENLNSNDNVTNIRLFNKSILPEYLVTFWNSKFGLKQVERFATGNVQPWLSMKQLRQLKTIILDSEFQQEIKQKIESAYRLRYRSIQSYVKAQQILEAELGLDKLHFEKPVGYTARFSELELSQRSDAEYFNPELRYFHIEIAKKHVLKLITEYASILKFSNPPYGSHGIPIITQKHLGMISPDKYGKDLIAEEAWVSANPLAVLRKNDLLYYSVGAYLGKTNLWLSNDMAVHASFITMLRCHDHADAGFLQVLLNSTYGVLQSKCFQSGTSQTYIYPKDVRRFLIPDVAMSLRQEIYNLVLESYEKAEESKQLLHQAKSSVEQLIEKAVQK